jgi:hypothetical protein
MRSIPAAACEAGLSKDFGVGQLWPAARMPASKSEKYLVSGLKSELRSSDTAFMKKFQPGSLTPDRSPK